MATAVCNALYHGANSGLDALPTPKPVKPQELLMTAELAAAAVSAFTNSLNGALPISTLNSAIVAFGAMPIGPPPAPEPPISVEVVVP